MLFFFFVVGWKALLIYPSGVGAEAKIEYSPAVIAEIRYFPSTSVVPEASSTSFSFNSTLTAAIGRLSGVVTFPAIKFITVNLEGLVAVPTPVVILIS